MWQISIDTGGTFTDSLAITPENRIKRLKILSSSHLRGSIINQIDDYTLLTNFQWYVGNDIFYGFEFEILQTGQKSIVKQVDLQTKIITLQEPLKKVTGQLDFQITSNEEVPVLAARLLTATPLGHEFPKMIMRLGSTRGTNALLERKGADVLFLTTKGFKDLIKIGNQQRSHLFSLKIEKPLPLYKDVIGIEERITSQGEVLHPITKDDIQDLLHHLQNTDRKTAIAIALVNSYKNRVHEELLTSSLQEAGFEYVSYSTDLANGIKILHRAETTIVNSYLLPVIKNYINGIEKHIPADNLRVMTSWGAVVNSKAFSPKDSLLSGPAGGVVGAQKTAHKSGFSKLITFDMGGTSTDVAIYNNSYDYRFETVVGEAHIMSPCLAIETIAAGGGSICAFKQGTLTVGPESAGAYPGPACYGADGPLTITDINLLCGRLVEDNFSIPLNKIKAQEALQAVRKEVTLAGEEVNETDFLRSFLTIANEKMAEAIKKVSVRKGYEPKGYALITFGGAGGQHACAIADLLEITNIIIPYDAGLLSAYGISQANIEVFSERQIIQPLKMTLKKVEEHWGKLKSEAFHQLGIQGFDKKEIQVIKKLAYLRFQGQETSVEIEIKDTTDYLKEFKDAYTQTYGHWLEDQEIEVESLKLVAAVLSPDVLEKNSPDTRYKPSAAYSQPCLTLEGWKEGDVYEWEELSAGAIITGPAIVVSQNCTVFIEPHWQFTLDHHENALLTKHRDVQSQDSASNPETANIELFKNRFISLVEEMGALLERTSFSVNVKERLDFSCALLDAEGELVANAPHIPVHLGSMGICVRKVLEHIPINQGDIIITNHPAYGGSHLPDITLISGVFVGDRLIGYVANRAHHAEIGGKTPGSMPTDATSLDEEGVIIEPRYLARNGEFFWQEMERLLRKGPYPSRAIDENLADLQGGVAALQAGSQALIKLCNLFGTDAVARYMKLLKHYVSEKLWEYIEPYRGRHFAATEKLDDGNQLSVQIKFLASSIEFNFTGTSPVHPGNLNATEAIVNSVVLYVLRLLIREELPLNEGLLKNVKLILPHCLLSPDFKSLRPTPAVVGGNTEISQRLTDTLLKALKLSACSQGTMNNLLFGNPSFGYYETICGGTGAGNGFAGHDAVHQHMTNTRITDPEIMELRYPIRINRFEIRKNSGGNGKWKGGDGVIRELVFLDNLQLTILSQHRMVEPYGMDGGDNGKTGEQYILTKDGQKHMLPGICSLQVNIGNRLVVKTPGGGGYGKL